MAPTTGEMIALAAIVLVGAAIALFTLRGRGMLAREQRRVEEAHPDIARLYVMGTGVRDRRFLAVRSVDGVPPADSVDERGRTFYYLHPGEHLLQVDHHHTRSGDGVPQSFELYVHAGPGQRLCLTMEQGALACVEEVGYF